VDRDEKLHDDCVAALEGWTGPVVTTKAVLTEPLYLVGPAWRAFRLITNSNLVGCSTGRSESLAPFRRR
jgi:hypothetical protein